METYDITDSQMKASSFRHDPDSFFAPPSNARLNHAGTGKVLDPWIPFPITSTDQQWIQVDLGLPYLLEGLLVQGLDDSSAYVSSINIYYSVDGISWLSNEAV